MASHPAVGRALEILRISKGVDREQLSKKLGIDRSGLFRREAAGANPRWSTIMANVEALEATWIEFARALLLVADETSRDDLVDKDPPPFIEPEDTSTKASLKALVDVFVEEIKTGEKRQDLSIELAANLLSEVSSIRRRIEALESGERMVADLLPPGWKPPDDSGVK